MLALTDLQREATRQLQICLACRYCEGYCAVFPALEREPVVQPDRFGYLATLCHDCRACYYACPFTEPHEFAVNVPRLMTDLRQDLYQRYSWPARFGAAYRSSIALTLKTLAFGMAIAAAVVLALNPAGFLAVRHGPGSFYQVVPWLLLLIPAMALSLGAIAVMTYGGMKFWRDSRLSQASGSATRSWLMGTVDVLRLRWLEGGGDGCYYPSEQPSRIRSWLHSLVFYGLALAFASTCAAAVQQDLLGQLPPYPILSVPVVTGTIGGVAIVVGCLGLWLVNRQANRQLGTAAGGRLDAAFLLLLGLASLTGLLTLALRETPLLSSMLVLHLGALGALYLTAPYSKLVHAVYRVLSVVRNRIEEGGDLQPSEVLASSAAATGERRHHTQHMEGGNQR